MRIRAGRFVVAAWLVVVAAPPAALGGDVPGSAYSGALGVHPLLLDDVDLMFEFPAAAAMRDSTPLALGRRPPGGFIHGSTTPNDEYSAGARFDIGPLTAFALSQYAYIPSSAFTTPSNVVQAGIAVGRDSRWRVGAAVRGLRAVTESSNTTYNATSENAQQDIVDYLAGSAGVGVAIGRARVDLAVEGTNLDYDISGLYRSSSDTIAVMARGHGDGLIVGSLRAAIPWGDRARFVAGGRFQAGEIHWIGNRYASVAPGRIAESKSVESWLGGLTAAFVAPRLDVVLLSMSFERMRDAQLATFTYERQLTRAVRQDVTHLGISFEERLASALDVRGGVVRSYETERSESTRLDGPYEFFSTARSERVSDTFTLGGTYRWRGMWFTAALSKTLRVTDLFTALDVHVEL